MLVLRILGAFMVVAAAAQIGNLYAARFDRRRKELKALSDALELLETEVSYGAVPLPRALERLGKRIPDPIGAFFRTARARLEALDDLGKAWGEAVSLHMEASCLTEKDADLLLPLGEVLGTSDRSDQSRHLKGTVKRLRQEEAEAARTAVPNARLWRSVGVFGGIALAILFL